MNLKINIVANYASQLYVTLIGIVLVPIYIQLLGAEAYGLVGFFSMLQAWFNLLDLGLSPTITRESARYHGGAMSALEYQRIFRALSTIFFFIAITGGTLLWLLSNTIANNWLKVETLSYNDVLLAIKIMAISVALRWISGLYRGVISGAERMVWISIFTVSMATLRFIGVLGSMWVWGYTISIFFIHQLIISGIEFSGLFLMSHKLLPKKRTSIGWSFNSIRPLLKFSLTIAFTSSIWVFVTQTDKLILSGIIPLTEYGYFSLAVMVASGIMIISGPISSAIMPRMARLHSEEKKEEMLNVYLKATNLAAIIAGSASITISICSDLFLYAWTGNSILVSQASPILRLYAIGNGILVLTAFPYYLQYAVGNLKFHLYNNIVTAIILIPIIIYASINYGSIGAGWVWLSFHLTYFTFGVWYTHKKLAPDIHIKWLVIIAKTIFPSIIAGYVTSNFFTIANYNTNPILEILTIATAVTMTSIISSKIGHFKSEA